MGSEEEITIRRSVIDINKVTLMGYIGQDPTFHLMGSGTNLCKFSIATSRRWKDKNTGEKKEDSSWHNVVVFNPYLVTICENWLQKGTRVYLEGELKTRSYEKDGAKRYITEVIIPQVKGELLVIERGKGWNTNETPGSDRGRSTEPGGTTRLGDAARAAVSREPGSDDGGFDDDIPF
jgi:single-strand DNA-binding protein